MTVIKPNSVAGINSITVQSGEALSVHKSDGSLIKTIVSASGVSTFTSASVGAATTDNNRDASINIGLGASISQHTVNSLSLGTGGDERLRITSGGLVGVGQATPTHMLHVDSSNASDSTATAFFKGRIIRFDGAASAHSPRLNFSLDGTDKAQILLHRTNVGLDISTLAAEPIKFKINSVEKLRISSQGYVTKPNMPAFLVYATGFGTKPFGQDHSNTDFDINYLEQIPIWGQQSISRTVVHNTGAHLTAHNYTTSGGSDGAYVKFTAPVAGYYVFFITATPAKSTVGDWWGFGLKKNFTSNNGSGDLDYYISSVNQAVNANEEKSMSGQTIAYLAKDDYVIPYARSCNRVTCTDRIVFGGYMLF